MAANPSKLDDGKGFFDMLLSPLFMLLTSAFFSQGKSHSRRGHTEAVYQLAFNLHHPSHRPFCHPNSFLYNLLPFSVKSYITSARKCKDSSSPWARTVKLHTMELPHNPCWFCEMLLFNFGLQKFASFSETRSSVCFYWHGCQLCG